MDPPFPLCQSRRLGKGLPAIAGPCRSMTHAFARSFRARQVAAAAEPEPAPLDRGNREGEGSGSRATAAAARVLQQRLSQSHPAFEDQGAAAAALERWGTGAGASRLITGNHPLYAELEARLAKLKGTQAACVFGSGYLANTGIIPALVGRDDLVLVDELAHACLWAGARLSGASVASVPAQ